MASSTFELLFVLLFVHLSLAPTDGALAATKFRGRRKVFLQPDLASHCPHCPSLQAGTPLFVDLERSTNFELPVGESVKFNCEVRGEPKPSLTWFRGGQELVPGDKGTERFTFYFYALTIDYLQREDEDAYACRASNEIGQSCWRNFSLIVVDSTYPSSVETIGGIQVPDPTLPHGPRFKIDKTEMSKLFASPWGGVANLRCPAEGNPTPNITWLKDGLPIKRRMGVKYRRWNLSMMDLEMADRGNCMCIVQNEYGVINHTIHVDVQDRLPHKPIFLDSSPRNMTVYEGETARFECRVLSDLSHSFSWFKYIDPNDTWVDEKGKVNVVPLKSDTPGLLVLPNVTAKDQGKYECKVGNALGLVQRAAWLTVLLPSKTNEDKVKQPVMESHVKTEDKCRRLEVVFKQQDASVYEGGSVRLECGVLNDTYPSVIWLKYLDLNGTWLDESGTTNVVIIPSDTPGLLVLSNVTIEDQGRYECLVDDPSGLVQRAARLTLTVLLRPPDQDVVKSEKDDFHLENEVPETE